MASLPLLRSALFTLAQSQSFIETDYALTNPGRPLDFSRQNGTKITNRKALGRVNRELFR